MRGKGGRSSIRLVCVLAAAMCLCSIAAMQGSGPLHAAGEVAGGRGEERRDDVRRGRDEPDGQRVGVVAVGDDRGLVVAEGEVLEAELALAVLEGEDALDGVAGLEVASGAEAQLPALGERDAGGDVERAAEAAAGLGLGMGDARGGRGGGGAHGRHAGAQLRPP